MERTAQRDCRKIDFGESRPRVPGTEHGQSSFSIALSGSGERPEDVDLADIVNQSEEPPLYIHFPF